MVTYLHKGFFNYTYTYIVCKYILHKYILNHILNNAYLIYY